MEYILYGLAKDATESWQEDLLLADESLERINKVIAIATRDGFHSFRIATFNGELPDFTKTINQKRS